MKKSAFVLVGAVIASTSLSGCWENKPCADGEFPVKNKNSSSNMICVKDGERVPKGYETYPPGQTPTSLNG